MIKNKSISHSLANKLTLMRIQSEKFLLDNSGRKLKNKGDREKLKEAIALIEGTIAQIDDVFECIY